MNRLARGTAMALAGGAMAATVLAAPVFAAGSTATTSAPTAAPTTTAPALPAARAHWEAVAGNFARVEDARELRARIAAGGITGFRVEVERRDGKTWFQVERPFLVRSKAAAQVAGLHAHGFRGWLEYDRVGDW
jgi:cell division septation protein DedD